jgi:hypothetical protein
MFAQRTMLMERIDEILAATNIALAEATTLFDRDEKQ